MKKIVRTMMVLLMVMVSSSALAKEYRYEIVPGDPMKTRIYTLDNGLKVYLSVNKEKPRMQTMIAVKTGSRNDPAENTGLSHYLEHLMFKGTTHFGTVNYAEEQPILNAIEAKYETYRTLTDTLARKACYREIDSLSQVAAKYNIPNEYDKLMSSIGAQGTNAYTGEDMTVYVEDVPANAVEKWLKVEAERFKNMVIRGFHTELEAVYEEYNMYSAQDGEKFNNALMALAYPGHPYGTQTTIGRPDHLKNPSIKAIKNYFKNFYVPNNMAMIIAGDFNSDEMIALIDRYFGDMKPNHQLVRKSYPRLAEDTAVRDTVVWGQEAERLVLGWRFEAGAHPQNDTLEVISQMLTNGRAGFLELKIEQQMKAQYVSCWHPTAHDYSGLFLFSAPVENQSLETLRNLIVSEMENFKKGEFADNLLPSVISNMKLRYFNSLLSNYSRADRMLDAFLMEKNWKDEVEKIDRLSRLTKQDIINFANRHFKNNYFCVFKKQGEDKNYFKIDKPAITPIQANRDHSSEWLNNFLKEEMKPIAPRFCDFKKDLTVTTVNGLPLLYKQNTDDQLFNLAFRYEFGTEDVKGLDLVPQYLYYIGTDKKSSAQIKQEFYELACSYSLSVSDDELTIYLSGLSENMPKALSLFDDFLKNAKGDKESYQQFVALIKKSREDSKTDQGANFNAFENYAIYGAYNPQTNTWTNSELESADPQALPQMVNGLNNMQHEVLYFGPYTVKELAKLLKKTHKTPKKLAAVPEGQPYKIAATTENEVLIAPYDAKNIYMLQFHSSNRKWNPEEATLTSLFNEYYGGSMNSVAFQEMREVRALAYSASAHYSTPRKLADPEYFYTFIISQNDKMMDCINAFKEIIDSVPASQAAFDLAKEGMKKSLECARYTRSSVLYRYVYLRKLGIEDDIYKQLYEQLPKVKLKDIINFEQQQMARKPLRTIILGDEKQHDMKALEKIAPVKRLTREEIFGF